MKVALDCESLGVDFWHGSRPFFVTICKDDGNQIWWEWNIDPLTRKVTVPTEDVWEIQSLLDAADTIIGQNLKFDSRMLGAIGIEIDWSKAVDTLIAGHLLASNQPHNLTAMVLHYLNRDIETAEVVLRKAVMSARLIAKRDYPIWRTAKEGLPDMPSVKSGGGRTERGVEKGSAWAADYWLPKAIAEAKGFKPGDKEYHWHTVLRDYSNLDSASTLGLWLVMERLLHQRKLMRIFHARMKLPAVALKVEAAGVTVSGKRLRELRCEYEVESERLGRLCTQIATNLGHDLNLPRAGNNQSLVAFAEALMQRVADQSHSATGRSFMVPRTDKGQIQLTKASIDYYESLCPERSPGRMFWRSLKAKRRRDTAVTYLSGYERFMIPVPGQTDWFRLHPSMNPTGTDTLRWSMANPNSSNFSKQEDRCPRCDGKAEDKTTCQTCNGTGVAFRSLRYILGPMPGREWWSKDAKNIELRIPAYEAGEKDLIALFERPDDPPFYGSEHLLSFSIVYPDIWAAAVEEVGIDKAGPYCKKRYASTWYQWVKNGDFAVGYGAIDRIDGTGTADRAFHKPGAHALLKTRFSKKEAHNQKCIRFAQKHGYVETIPDRSVDQERGYPIMCTRTERGYILPTVPLNYRTQSTAMWWTSQAMVRCQEQLDRWREEDGFDGLMILQVHDEIVWDFPRAADPRTDPENSNLWRMEVMKGHMEIGGDHIGIPTPTSLSFHPEVYSEEVSF
jgi:DNA polymerase I-like protein with 3'-5' exonuclease and polymerase domains